MAGREARAFGLTVAFALCSVPIARADDAWRPHILDALAPRAIGGASDRAWPASPLLEEARAAVGAELAWERGGTRGAGATICVIDTGVDLSHRDFLDDDGRTRVRWLLDLDAGPRGVHGALERGGGAVWSRDEIDAALSRGETVAPDWHGHGTSIASAAAGDDSPSVLGDPGFRAGIAPEAELVIVRALRRSTFGFHDDDVVRAARFCVEPRVSEPARTVVLLALGGHDGPHDGTSAYERAIGAITLSGAAVVAAAGNDGDLAVHAAARLVGAASAELVVRLPPPEIDDAIVAVVVRGAREVRASLDGGALTPWVVRGQASETTPFLIDATDASATYVIAHGALAAGDLVIEARGAEQADGALDAWIVEARLGAALFSPRFVGALASASEEITIPATSDGVIAVGASVSRDFLAGEDRPGLTLSADERGRALFSSRGPRVDGAPLPTLLAPGGWIVAARSMAIDPTDRESLFGGATERFEAARRGEDRLAVAGTSVAAAIVAGAVALDRSTGGGELDDRAALAASAVSHRASVDSLAPYDARVGAGVLDVPGYLIRRREAGTIDDALELGCTRETITPATRDLAVVVRSRSGGEARVRARVAGEPWSGTRAMRGGHASLPVEVPPLAIDREVVIEVEVDGRIAEACRLPVRDPGQERPLAVGGGCSLSRGESPVVVAFCVMGLAIHRSRARRRGVVLRSRP